MKSKSGFSLLELSIVLVIIGLIAGGIVAGSSMIRAAELRAVTTEFSQYQTSLNTFRDKYLGYPGEIKNAEDFWGTAHATDATCITTVATGTATCNGDGNGEIDVSARSNERFRFWQHLANAELISGTFTGVQGVDGNDALIGENVPESKLSGGGWYSAYLGTAAGADAFTVVDYGNAFYFGANQVGQPTYERIFTPSELWNLDKKLDDGMPGQGKVIAFRIAGCTNAADGTDITTDYALDTDSLECAAFFKNMF